MSLGLPYFKFEPSEWQNGNIQVCSPEAKLIFIELVCAYWQKEGCVRYAFAMRVLCGGNSTALQELIDEGIITVDSDDKIGINFLDKQLKEVITRSNKAAESARKRWSKMRTHSERNANAMPSQCERNASRVEYSRVEYSKVNNEKKLIKKTEESLSKIDKASLNAIDPALAPTWEGWLRYKKEDKGFKYKSEKSEKIALRQAWDDAGQNAAQLARNITESIKNGYSGLFAAKKQKQPTGQPQQENKFRSNYETVQRIKEGLKNQSHE